MFDKILIANRGEIAVRVARTARRLGVRTVAVYSEVDRDALHVAVCDEAVAIGGAAPKDSYLRAEAILEAARRTGAQAIHPGYGFLSENEGFARACAQAGIVFIGPPPEAIEAMGLKAEAKRLMERAGVPLVPGYHGVEQDDALLAREAERIGFPVLIKASAGGGGKGMKVALRPSEFAEALASARREALAAFGDERVILERYLERPRHIEIQVFADCHGHCLYLFERDCSLQRRHQKVIEEAPAPGLPQAIRRQMGEAAVAAARAVGYVGAGTVEFIAEADVAESGRFYFMEMNTRLQVEHPVTEMITGLDLVEWQLRVAAGEPLPLSQEDLAIRGHAIEARIYAENPAAGFLPATGTIERLALPETSESVRIDTGVREGDAITPHYDPMIAKLITHGATREEALSRLAAALDRFAVMGFANNVAFLARVARHPEFVAGRVDTGFIPRHAEALIERAPGVDPQALAALALSEWLLLARANARDPSPWARVDGFWLGQAPRPFRVLASDATRSFTLELTVAAESFRFAWQIEKEARTEVEDLRVAGEHPEGELAITLAGHRFRARVLHAGRERLVLLEARRASFTLIDPYAPPQTEDPQAGHLTAPMPGSIVAVYVKPGDTVERGQPLLVIEAMKMEHTIVAPFAGRIEAVYFAPREQVKEGAELVALVPESGD
ncbi:MAG: acetyl/propionyl/methylcrotonyl-CoA carboxylase subunit alpha [Burkholderiales bacterium]|nr:acetyl/propionyl/methylcrotonyl-CoA carboxylase subunit alpha [Burkholderiales bacterium]